MAETPNPSPAETGAAEAGMIREVPTFETETPADTGPTFEDPKPETVATPDNGERVTAAQDAVAAAVEAPAPAEAPAGQVQPPRVDVAGYNVRADGYKNTRDPQHAAEMSQAADALNRANGIPTDAEKAAMRAEDQKPRGFMARLKRWFT